METELATFLAGHPPFEALAPDVLASVAAAARVERFRRGQLIVDAFATPTVEVFVVLEGRVELWNHADQLGQPGDERLGVGGMFGFSAMLTERSIGPRAIATTDVVVARIPAATVQPAFVSPRGASFLAEQMSAVGRRPAGTPSYSTVDELIVRQPLLVEPTTSAGDVARRMTQTGAPCAVVALGEGRFGLVTDAQLRRRIVVDGLPQTTPAADVMVPSAPASVLGDSAAEALIVLLDWDADFLPVTDRAGELRGVITPRDFAVSPTTAGVSLHEQLRRAGTVEELDSRARGIPGMLGHLLKRGLASGKVIAVYSSILDTVVRRAIQLVFAQHPELSVDAFTWLSLGSNGRREAVLSSDVDSAVAFDDGVTPAEIERYRVAFGEVYAVLTGAGLSSDEHGATAQHKLFARTNAQWRAEGERWLAAPAQDNGAIMTSLLVDARPIHGDPGLPVVTELFTDLRRHPGTMRLLLQESLSSRAKLRTIRDVFARRPETFDVKSHALVPIANIARWAALTTGSLALPTTERLAAAAGSAMLPDEQAGILIEVFEVLQRLRLRYQLSQYRSDDPPSDVLVMKQMSPIDRAVIAQAVREISAVQRRMDNIANYVEASAWTAADSS